MKSRTSPRRILNILEEILVDPDNYTAKKISHKLKIPLATVYRQLEILCEEGFLIQNINKTFIPGPKIRALGKLLRPRTNRYLQSCPNFQS